LPKTTKRSTFTYSQGSTEEPWAFYLRLHIIDRKVELDKTPDKVKSYVEKFTKGIINQILREILIQRSRQITTVWGLTSK